MGRTTSSLDQGTQDQVRQAIHIVSLCTCFRDIVAARLEHDRTLKRRFEEAAGADTLSRLMRNEQALQLAAFTSGATVDTGDLEHIDQDDLCSLNEVLGQSLSLSEEYAVLATRVMAEQDVAALMPVDLHRAEAKEWLKAKQMPQLSALCRA